MSCFACPGSGSAGPVHVDVDEEEEEEDAWTLLCGWASVWGWPIGMVAAGLLNVWFSRRRRPTRIWSAAAAHLGAVSLSWVYVAWLFGSLLCAHLRQPRRLSGRAGQMR